MKHVFILGLVFASACATVSPSPSRHVAAVQIICYADSGQPLFPVQIVDDVKIVSGEPLEATYQNGMHVWIRASACIAAEMTADDLATMKASASAKSKSVVPPAPSPSSSPSPSPSPSPPAESVEPKK